MKKFHINTNDYELLISEKELGKSLHKKQQQNKRFSKPKKVET